MPSLLIRQKWFDWPSPYRGGVAIGGALYESDGVTPLAVGRVILIANDDTPAILYKVPNTLGRWDFSVYPGANYRIGAMSEDGTVAIWRKANGFVGDWASADIYTAPLADSPNLYPMKAPTSFYPIKVMGTHPVAYWRLGEKTGTVAVDKTGAHNGTYVGAPTLGVKGAINNDIDSAVLLDGADDYVAVADFAGASPSVSGEMTVMLWVTPGSTSQVSVPIGKAGGPYEWALSLGTGVEFKTWSADGTTLRDTVIGGVLSDGVPAHIAVAVVNGSVHDIYVDGALVMHDAGTWVGTTDTSSPIAIGNRGDGNGAFSGVVDEVAIWDRALEDWEVAMLYEAGTQVSNYENAVVDLAPVGYWRLGEREGQVVHARVGVNGSLTGAPTLGVPGLVDGDTDTAIEMVGGSYVKATGAPLSGPYSAIAVATVPDLPAGNYGRVINHVWFDDGAWLLTFFGDIGRTCAEWWSKKADGGTGHIRSAPLAVGSVVHLAGTHDGSTATLYVDGVAVGSAQSVQNPSATSDIDTNTTGATVTIDEIALFDRALTPAEIAHLYAVGTGAALREVE